MTDAGAVSKKGTQASNSTCAPIIRKWDSHAEAMIDESTATAFGGTMTLFGYIIMFVWTIWYIAGIYDPAGDNISSTTTIVNFPTNEDGCHGEGEEACSLTLPRMTCIAEGGCWARFMKAYGDSGKWCVFVAEDDEFPDFAREIYQTPDPTDQMTVLWNKYDTGNNDINFGVSYDRVRVTNKLTGETETIEAGGTSSIYSSKIYQGATIMSLSRTSGAGDWLQGAAKYAVDSWTNLVISRDGSDVSSDNLCCMSSNEGSILDVDGNVVTDDSYLTDCTDFTEVRIAPMPTYPHERVSEWAWSLFEGFGGMLSTVTSVLAAFVAGYNLAVGCKSTPGGGAQIQKGEKGDGHALPSYASEEGEVQLSALASPGASSAASKI